MNKTSRKILNFIKDKNLMVVSTISSNGTPESAVVGFSQTAELEIIFGTSYTTRKYKNLQKNNKVSLVIGWDSAERITIQYEGIAREVHNEELKQCRELHVKKNPGSKKYALRPEQRFFKITPKWIRYSNLTKEPAEIEEITSI